MSNDLVRQLRCYADIDDAVYHPWVYGEAADHIEKLEANFQLQLEWYLSNKRVLDDRIEKLEAALIAIKAMHHEGGIDDLTERDDRTYFIVCDALEGKDDPQTDL